MKIAIVGAGFYGATLAYLATRAGHNVLVYESEATKIGGNAASHFSPITNCHVSDYGAHIFHTNSQRVWDFVCQFSSFNGYRHYVKAWTGTKMVDLPFGMSLFSQILGISTPADARRFFDGLKSSGQHLDTSNVEGWCLQNIGDDLYQAVVKGYTEKQWGRPCSELPASIIQRLPMRFTYDNTYFHNAKYQGMPTIGYSGLVQAMLSQSVVVMNSDVGMPQLANLEANFDRVYFSGPVDRLFDYGDGVLAYRGLQFEDIVIHKSDSQGAPVVNRTAPATSFSSITRNIEHAMFYPEVQSYGDATLVTSERSAAWSPGDRPYYPIRDEENLALYALYEKTATSLFPKTRLGGRLGTYQYLDMDQAIGQAMSHAKEFL